MVVANGEFADGGCAHLWQTALRSGDAREAAAAKHVLQAFCRDNSEGQQMLAATLAPVGDTHAESAQGAS